MIQIIETQCGRKELQFPTLCSDKSSNRRGAMAYVMLLSLFCFVVLGMFLMDLGRTSARKVEMQQVADSSAFSASLMITRGMNAITASNHHIGEVMSFIVLHKAIAGDNVDGRDKTTRQVIQDETLTISLSLLGPAAKSVGGRTVTYPECARKIRAAETVCDSKLQLKLLIESIYAGQLVAAYYGQFEVINELSELEEFLIKPEWDALNRMEQTARQDLHYRKSLENAFLARILRYQEQVLHDIPALSSETAKSLAEVNHGQGTIFPSKPELPVEYEEYAATHSNHRRSMAKTQIVRATYPWVVFDRSPILMNTAWMKASGTSIYYHKWTDHDTTERCLNYYVDHDKPMLVIKHNNLPEKGNELWTKDPRDTDSLFSIIAFAYEPSPRPFGMPALKHQNEAGLVTYAQALTYNANSQKPGQADSRYQPEIGWDTLNWEAPVKIAMAYEYPAKVLLSTHSPRVRLNWQSKLVPVTAYLDQSPGEIPGRVSGVLNRILPVPKAIRTH
jgi:hypothetical protein